MSFFNQNLKFKNDFESKIDLDFTFFKPIFYELKSKFYTLYSDDGVHFLDIDIEFLNFLNTNADKLLKFTKKD